jgi:hypothetical protein
LEYSEPLLDLIFLSLVYPSTDKKYAYITLNLLWIRKEQY